MIQGTNNNSFYSCATLVSESLDIITSFLLDCTPRKKEKLGFIIKFECKNIVTTGSMPSNVKYSGKSFGVKDWDNVWVW